MIENKFLLNASAKKESHASDIQENLKNKLKRVKRNLSAKRENGDNL